MINIWEVLEIEPTDDRGKIRKAYSNLLKKYHPEDDSDAYEKLRLAYETALQLTQVQVHNQEHIFIDENNFSSAFLFKKNEFEKLEKEQSQEQVKIKMLIENEADEVLKETRELLKEENINNYSMWSYLFAQNKGNEKLILNAVFNKSILKEFSWDVSSNNFIWRNTKDISIFNLLIIEAMGDQDFQKENKSKINILKKLIKYERYGSRYHGYLAISAICTFGVSFLFGLFLLWQMIDVQGDLPASITMTVFWISCSYCIPSYRIAKSMKNKADISFQLYLIARNIVINFFAYIFCFIIFLLDVKMSGAFFFVLILLFAMYYKVRRKRVGKELGFKIATFKTYSKILFLFTMIGVIGLFVSIVNAFLFQEEQNAKNYIVIMLIYIFVCFAPVYFGRLKGYENVKVKCQRVMSCHGLFIAIAGFCVIVQEVFGLIEVNHEDSFRWLLSPSWIITLICIIVMIYNKKKSVNE